MAFPVTEGMAVALMVVRAVSHFSMVWPAERAAPEARMAVSGAAVVLVGKDPGAAAAVIAAAAVVVILQVLPSAAAAVHLSAVQPPIQFPLQAQTQAMAR